MNIRRSLVRQNRNLLAVHPDVMKRTMDAVNDQCSLYYIIIGSVYNLAQSSMLDAKVMLEETKHWKHEVKRDVNKALAAYDTWNSKMKAQLRDRYQMWLDISDDVAEKMKMHVQKLRWSYDAVLMRHNDTEHLLKAHLLTALTMNDLALSTFRKYIADGSEKTKVDMRLLFSKESSFKDVATNWENAVRRVLKCSGGDIDCNKDNNCVLAADIIRRKLADFAMYEEACGYGAEYNPEVIAKYIDD